MFAGTRPVWGNTPSISWRHRSVKQPPNLSLHLAQSGRFTAGQAGPVEASPLSHSQGRRVQEWFCLAQTRPFPNINFHQACYSIYTKQRPKSIKLNFDVVKNMTFIPLTGQVANRNLHRTPRTSRALRPGKPFHWQAPRGGTHSFVVRTGRCASVQHLITSPKNPGSQLSLGLQTSSLFEGPKNVLG